MDYIRDHLFCVDQAKSTDKKLQQVTSGKWVEKFAEGRLGGQWDVILFLFLCLPCSQLFRSTAEGVLSLT